MTKACDWRLKPMGSLCAGTNSLWKPCLSLTCWDGAGLCPFRCVGGMDPVMGREGEGVAAACFEHL